jgi:hypothetical protein
MPGLMQGDQARRVWPGDSLIRGRAFKVKPMSEKTRESIIWSIDG